MRFMQISWGSKELGYATDVTTPSEMVAEPCVIIVAESIEIR